MEQKLQKKKAATKAQNQNSSKPKSSMKQNKASVPHGTAELLAGICSPLKDRRGELGLSIDALAEKSDTSYMFLSHLERGISKGVQLGKLSQVCAALGLRLVLTVEKL